MVNKIKTLSEREEELIKIGKEKGYITYEKLAEELKGLEVDSDTLDELYTKLVSNGIEIIASEDENSEGEKKYKVDIILSEFTFIDSKKKAVNEVIQEEVPF